MTEQNRDIVVVGASAGGTSAIATLAAGLHETLAASVMVVLHVSPTTSPESPARTLCPKTRLACESARTLTTVQPGRIYVAPPDRHLRLVEKQTKTLTQLDRGPRENRSRPSIDALFRSAAASCGARVIGILLTGYLDDGVAGLAAIQRVGGRIMVQDPSDAEVDEMPRRALEALSVDACLPVSKMASVIHDLVSERIDGEAAPIPEDLRMEAALAARAGEMWPELDALGEPTPVGCPECGGPLWSIRGGKPDEHFRCHVGHGFTPLALMGEQEVAAEQALHYAIRLIEERTRMLRGLAGRSGSKGRYSDEAARAEKEAETLRSLILGRHARD